jgi:hypothetical protein
MFPHPFHLTVIYMLELVSVDIINSPMDHNISRGGICATLIFSMKISRLDKLRITDFLEGRNQGINVDHCSSPQSILARKQLIPPVTPLSISFQPPLI